MYPGRYGVKPVRDAESTCERFELNCVINVCGRRYLLNIYFSTDFKEKVMDIVVISPNTRLFSYKKEYTEKVTEDYMADVIEDIIKYYFNPTHGKVLAELKPYYTRNPENALYHDMFLRWFLITSEPDVRSKTIFPPPI